MWKLKNWHKNWKALQHGVLSTLKSFISPQCVYLKVCNPKLESIRFNVKIICTWHLVKFLHAHVQ